MDAKVEGGNDGWLGAEKPIVKDEDNEDEYDAALSLASLRSSRCGGKPVLFTRPGVGIARRPGEENGDEGRVCLEITVDINFKEDKTSVLKASRQSRVTKSLHMFSSVPCI